jgi:redox-sensitive bicupin YhaK (pirin superfamily)
MIEAIWTGLRLPAGGFQNVVAAPVAPDGKMRAIGPFVAIAHAQPTLLAPGALPLDDDVRPHPHIGIAALSYLFDGAMTHRDSLGATQVIEPGAVNWMVAGRGVVHSERYETLRRDGGRMHGLQIWVALPEAHEGDEPSFHHHSAVEVPEFEGDGVRGRLLAGAADAHGACVLQDQPRRSRRPRENSTFPIGTRPSASSFTSDKPGLGIAPRNDGGGQLVALHDGERAMGEAFKVHNG